MSMVERCPCLLARTKCMWCKARLENGGQCGGCHLTDEELLEDG